MSAKPRSLRLSQIARGMPGLSPTRAKALVEAAEVCLDHQGHDPGVLLEVSGHVSAEYSLAWEPPSPVQRRTYADEQEATEEGATAVAVAVITEATEYLVVERAVKGTGIDYWLGHEAGCFEARLEISGIRRGEESVVETRTQQKLAQMSRSSDVGLPGYAVVVEFGNPRARVVAK